MPACDVTGAPAGGPFADSAARDRVADPTCCRAAASARFPQWPGIPDVPLYTVHAPPLQAKLHS